MISRSLDQLDKEAVSNTGNQTIAGIKTFTSSPIVPVPTADTQAANKAYADTKQANLGFTPVQQGGGAGQGVNKVYIGWSGSRLKAQVDSTDMGNIVFDANLNAAVGTATAGLGAGAVGSYGFFAATAGVISFGGTLAGSNLRPAGIGSTGTPANNRGLTNLHMQNTAQTGTWRCMGYSYYYVDSEGGTSATTSLWLRIS